MIIYKKWKDKQFEEGKYFKLSLREKDVYFRIEIQNITLIVHTE